MKFVIISALFLVLMSCSSSAPQLSQSNLPKMSAAAMGVAFRPSLVTKRTTLAPHGCVLVITRTGDERDFEISVNRESTMALFELPAGAYEFRELNCSDNTWNLSTKNLRVAGFKVLPGSISFLNGLSLYITAETLSTENMKSSETRSDLLKFFEKLPAHSRNRIVSGYSGKPISKASVEGVDGPGKWKVDPFSGKKSSDPDTWPSFEGCYDAEKQHNPLWLGELKVSAVYKKKRLAQSSFGNDWHTFTESFKDCAKQTLKDFQPGGSRTVTYTLYL